MRHVIYVRTYGEELTSVVPVKTQKVSGERTSKQASKQAPDLKISLCLKQILTFAMMLRSPNIVEFQ